MTVFKETAFPEPGLHPGTNYIRTVSLWIDVYDDLFSDFDPRPYSNRNLSDDFLAEVQKMLRENESVVTEFELLVPGKERDLKTETIIVKRLHDHFRKTHQYLRKQLSSRRRKGGMWFILGLFMMLTASYISSLRTESFPFHLLLVLLEPAGWYLCWMGLDAVFKSERTRDAKLLFYTRMQRCKILFRTIA
jgi:hypothetical protein